MLKDITLGQYFPGDTVVHRLDPRTKIIITMLYIVGLFFVQKLIGYIPVAIFVFSTIALSRISLKMVLKSVKPILFIISFTALLNLFYTDGQELWSFGFLRITYEGILTAISMTLRLTFLVMGTSLLTYTTSPIMLTDAIEHLLNPLKRIKVPVHELSMMMTIALRFIPTLIEETDKIMSAQKARGADFESGRLIERAKALIPILVPLFISAFRRADELAVAMDCRCYQGGEGRTRLRQPHYQMIDLWAFLITGLFIAAMAYPNFL